MVCPLGKRERFSNGYIFLYNKRKKKLFFMGTIKKIESIPEETVKSNEEVIAEAMALSEKQEKATKTTKKRTSKTKKSKEVATKEKAKEEKDSEIEIETIYDESKDSIKEKVAEIIDSEGAVLDATTLDNSSTEPKKKSTRGRKPKAKEPEKELDIPFEDSLPRKKLISENTERIHEEKRHEHPDYPPVILYPPEKKNHGIVVMCILTAALLVAVIVSIVMLFGIKEINQDILDQISNNTKVEEPVTKEEKESSTILETKEEIITDSTTETTKEKVTRKSTEAEKETIKKQEETTTVEEVTKKSTGSEELDVLCDNILNSIINDNMTDVEKARAAYDWVTTNISYVMSDKCDTWQEQAIQTINSYSGDCTGYYAILRALFERIGFECEGVESITQEHIWVIAKVNGEWYHFDATPGWGSDRFMYTTDEMLSYTYYGNDKYPDGLKYSFSTSKLPKD